MSGFLLLLCFVLHGVWFPNPSLFRVARCLVSWSFFIPCSKVSVRSWSCSVPCCKVSDSLLLLYSVLQGVCFPDPALFRVARCLFPWSWSVPCCKVSDSLLPLYSVLQGIWFPAPALFHVARYPAPALFPWCMMSGFLLLLYSVLQGIWFLAPALFCVVRCLVSWSCSVPFCMVSGSVPVCKVSGSLFLLRSKLFGFLILLYSVFQVVWFPDPALFCVPSCLFSCSCFILCSKVFRFLILLYSVLQGVWSLIPDLFVLHGVWFPDPLLFRVVRWLVLWSFYIPCRKVSCFLILLFRVASWRCLVDHWWVLFCLVSKCVWFFDIALFHLAGCLVVVWYCSFASLCGSLILLSSVWCTFGRSMFHVVMCFVKFFDHVVFHVAT